MLEILNKPTLVALYLIIHYCLEICLVIIFCICVTAVNPQPADFASLQTMIFLFATLPQYHLLSYNDS